MKLTLNDIRKLSGVEIFNTEFLTKKKVTGVSTDSRSVQQGNIFIALRGEKFDAHQFIDTVILNGACAVVVDAQWKASTAQKLSLLKAAIVVVPDTTLAFGELAREYRRKFKIPVLAIGGSNGKTTTKEMISAVLQTKFTILATEGNLNNHIGVPQMLFRLTSKHDIAVLELGTNHFGELQYLCELVEPTHALITNIGKEHLEFFGDEHGVAQEETALFRYIAQNNGFAFVNTDDLFLRKAGKVVRKKITYGTSTRSSFKGTRIMMNASGQPRFDVLQKGKRRKFAVQLASAGMHNVSNALAAAAVGSTFRVSAKKISGALGKFSSTSKRMEIIHRNGIIILNDTYNANPDSVIVALETLRAIQTSGKKIVVLGDMRELGDASKREHINIGVAVAEMKFDHLFTTGHFSKYTHDAAQLPAAKYFETKEELASSLKQIVKQGDVVLVKGSRGMKMEDVVAQL